MEQILERLKKLQLHVDEIVGILDHVEHFTEQDVEVAYIVLESAIKELDNQKVSIYGLMKKNAN